MSLKDEFARWFHPRSPQAYKSWYGKNLDGKLNDIDNAYMVSFKKSLFNIDFDNIEAEISKIKYNTKERFNADDKTFAEYDKKMCSGIPKAIINNYYVEFLRNYSGENGIENTSEFPPKEDEYGSFSYEKDLQDSLFLQAKELFPGYEVFGNNVEGKEYNIYGKKIDLLLENKAENKLLVIEMKAGLADFKVFGQISMYMGPLKKKYPDKEIFGVIIAKEIDDSLKMAISSNEKIKAMTYKVKIALEEVGIDF
jgi:hypothetical protein